MSQFYNEMLKHVKSLKVNDDAWELAPDDEGTAIVDSITGDWVAVIGNSPAYSSSELAGVFLNSLQFARDIESHVTNLEGELEGYDEEFEQIRTILESLGDKNGNHTARVAYFLRHLLFPDN